MLTNQNFNNGYYGYLSTMFIWVAVLNEFCPIQLPFCEFWRYEKFNQKILVRNIRI